MKAGEILNVAIDGPVGAGKSSVADAVAEMKTLGDEAIQDAR